MEGSLPIWTDSVGERTLKDGKIHKKVFRSPSLIPNASTVENRYKSRLVPVTTHPLSQQTPTSSHSKKEQSFTTLRDRKAQGPSMIKKRHGLPDFANAHSNNINDNRIELEKRKMVIVHVVKPSDTLAGVALFYGIELSILKKANKLWTSDSIHMRKDLYIPLEHCTIIADEANVMVQENHITIINRSSTSDSPRPSMSSSTTPFAIYERDLFTANDDHDNIINNVRDSSGASTSMIWPSSSLSPSSTSSSLSNSSGTAVTSFTNYTCAEIQQLPSAQLSYFPPRHSTACSANSNPTFLPSPSPIPITYLSKNNSHIQVSIPGPTITTESQPTIVNKLLSSAGEKYRKTFGSVKLNRRETPISLNKKKL